MNTKEHTKELKELEGRRFFLTIKTHRTSLSTLLFWASLYLVLGVIGLYYNYAAHPWDRAFFFKILIDPYTGFFLAISMIWFTEAFNYDINPKTRHEFSMKKKYRGMLMELFNVVSIYGSLFVLLSWLLREVYLIIWFVLAPLFLIRFVFIMIKFVKEFPKLMSQYERFGISRIQLEEDVVQIGDLFSVHFQNEQLYRYVKEASVYLRNLKEDIIKEGEIERQVTFVLYEDHHIVPICSKETKIHLRIPCQEVKPTDFEAYDPFYWELEISNKEVDFYSRFLIEVQN